jgi:hypothetical protein
MSHLRYQSLEWWNSNINAKFQQSETSLSPPPISQVLFAFLEISPPLVLLYDSRLPDERFWDLFHKVCASLSGPHGATPPPNSNFLGFLDALFSIRHRLQFSSPQDIALLLQTLPDGPDPQFLLWKFPTHVDCPFSYLQTLIYMHQSKSQAWTRFLAIPGSLDQLFDRYLPLLGPSGNRPAVSILASLELLMTLMIDRTRLLSRLPELCDLLWSKLMALMQGRDLSIVVSAARAAICLFQFARPHFPADHLADWLDELVIASAPPSIVHITILNFVIQLKFSGFKYMKVVRAMITQGLKSPADFVMFKKLLLLPQIEKPLAAIQFLFLRAFNDPIFGRSAAEVLREPLARFADLQVVVSWLTLFLRRTFIFVGVSAVIGRYHAKRMRILSLFESLQDSRIEWINESVIRYYSSLVNSERLRHNIVGIGLERITDYKFLNQVDDVVRQAPSIKGYFDCTNLDGEQCCSPVTARVVPAKIRSSQSKPTLIKKPRSLGARKTGSPRLAVPKPRTSPSTIVRSRSLGFSRRNGT